MRTLLIVLMSLFFAGCATWQGVKQDTGDAAEWSKEKVNQGATYVKEKTE
ncbi:MAG: hypothetical protein IBX45_04245 [Campylobacterales bacterium]|nr:hypothetical protein [Campylobacterales bacterium]